MQLRPAALFAAAVLATALVGTAPAQAASRVVLSTGHVDVIDVEYADGALEVHVHDESVEPDVEREPNDVLFRALPAARTTVPDDPGYAFLGTAGAPIWVLPETQNPDLLWPGISTEEVEPGTFATDSVTLKLSAVQGPGRFSVFNEGTTGAPNVLFNSGDGLPDTTAVPVAGHTHANWSFGATGIYRLTFKVSATLANGGGTVTSGPITYLFKVG